MSHISLGDDRYQLDTHLNTIRHSIPEANSDSSESQIVSSSPSGLGTIDIDQ